jgi:hypothetical protein
MRRFFALFSLAGIFLIGNTNATSLDYDKGVLDTIKLLQNQPDIDVPQTPYWLVLNVTDLGKGTITLKMVKLQKKLFNPVLIWFAGEKYIVIAGDTDPYHLKELEKIAGLENAKIVSSKDFKGYRKLYISLSKECDYPIFTLDSLIYTLQKRISQDVKNPRKKRRLLNLIRQIKEELKPSSEEEIWELLKVSD